MNKPGKRTKKNISTRPQKAEGEDIDENQPRYNRIKAVLAEKNIPNKELARRMAKTEGTVSNWCTNFKQPSIETLFEIAKAIEAEPSELLNTIKKSGL